MVNFDQICTYRPRGKPNWFTYLTRKQKNYRNKKAYDAGLTICKALKITCSCPEYEPEFEEFCYTCKFIIKKNVLPIFCTCKSHIIQVIPFGTVLGRCKNFFHIDTCEKGEVPLMKKLCRHLDRENPSWYSYLNLVEFNNEKKNLYNFALYWCQKLQIYCFCKKDSSKVEDFCFICKHIVMTKSMPECILYDRKKILSYNDLNYVKYTIELQLMCDYCQKLSCNPIKSIT